MKKPGVVVTELCTCVCMRNLKSNRRVLPAAVFTDNNLDTFSFLESFFNPHPLNLENGMRISKNNISGGEERRGDPGSGSDQH